MSVLFTDDPLRLRLKEIEEYVRVMKEVMGEWKEWNNDDKDDGVKLMCEYWAAGWRIDSTGVRNRMDGLQ